MNVGIFSPALMSPTPGGAERAACNLGGWLSARGHRVFMYHNRSYAHAPPYYPFDKDLSCSLFPQTHDLKGMADARSMLVAHGVDILCGFVWDNAAELCLHILRNTKIPFVYAERSEPKYVKANFWNAQRHAVYTAMAESIVLLCERFRAWYPEAAQDRITVIPNAIKRPETQASVKGSPAKPKRLLAVGRIDANKQFHLLIQAFAGLAGIFPDWQLRLCGTGPELPACQELARRLGIEDRVAFAGNVSDIYAEYAAAHAFCLPSRSEGFPNVLGEAMRHGLPVVGFAACAGVAELIAQGRNGLLAPAVNAESLAETLYPLLAKPSLRVLMGRNAEQMSRRFDPETVYPLWEKALLKTIADKQACSGGTAAGAQGISKITDQNKRHSIENHEMTFRAC